MGQRHRRLENQKLGMVWRVTARFCLRWTTKPTNKRFSKKYINWETWQTKLVQLEDITDRGLGAEPPATG